MSKVSESGTIPSRLTSPCVGFRPTIPFEVEGPRTEPPVSVPTPSCASQAATAAPVPPEEPEGVRATSWGLRM